MPGRPSRSRRPAPGPWLRQRRLRNGAQQRRSDVPRSVPWWNPGESGVASTRRLISRRSSLTRARKLGRDTPRSISQLERRAGATLSTASLGVGERAPIFLAWSRSSSIFGRSSLVAARFRLFDQGSKWFCSLRDGHELLHLLLRDLYLFPDVVLAEGSGLPLKLHLTQPILLIGLEHFLRSWQASPEHPSCARRAFFRVPDRPVQRVGTGLCMIRSIRAA